MCYDISVSVLSCLLVCLMSWCDVFGLCLWSCAWTYAIVTLSHTAAAFPAITTFVNVPFYQMICESWLRKLFKRSLWVLLWYKQLPLHPVSKLCVTACLLADFDKSQCCRPAHPVKNLQREENFSFDYIILYYISFGYISSAHPKGFCVSGLLFFWVKKQMSYI